MDRQDLIGSKMEKYSKCLCISNSMLKVAMFWCSLKLVAMRVDGILGKKISALIMAP
jgi:hypothetical protein